MIDTLDLYTAYAKERENLETIREEHGFLTYKWEDPDILFVNDVYVQPEHRGGPTFLRLAKRAEEIGFKMGAKYMVGVCYTNTNDPTLSAKSIMSYGLKIVAADVGKIYFRKEIKGPAKLEGV